MEPLRVLTADDDPIFRDGLRSYSHPLRTPPWSARRRPAPRRSSERSSSSPTPSSLDLHLPGANGIEATRRIGESSPHVGVLVLTMFDDDSGWLASLR